MASGSGRKDRHRSLESVALVGDREAVTHVVEFTLALTFFLFILQAFSAAMDFRLQAPLMDDTLREAQLFHLVGHFIRSPGSLDNLSVNDTAWETYPLYSSGASLSSNLTSLGFAQKDRPGTLWEAKVLGLRKLDYRQVISLLGLAGNQLQLKLTVAGETTPFMDWGSDFRFSRGGSTLTRIVGLANETSVRPARLQVWLFEGPAPKTSVKVTEVMHSPPGGYLNLEWVELYNPGDMVVDLKDWELVFNSETDSFKPTLGQGSLLAGHEYAVVVNGLANAVELRVRLDLPDQVLLLKLTDDEFGSRELRDNMSFLLRDSVKTIQDRVDYDPAEGAVETNETMERVSLTGAADDPTNWQVSQSGGTAGTPGRPNSLW